jgi:hypothetical protein
MQAILPEFVDYPQHLHALLNFDGVNDYITVSDNNSLDATSDVTVSAWIKADDWNGQGGVNYSTIVKKDKNYILRADSDGSFGGAGDQLKMYWWDGSNITATAVPLPSTRAWHHIVGVVANNAVSGVYIDGILQSGTSGTAADARDLTVNLSIGNHQTGSNETFHGTIDEVKIYNYALSYDEIKLEYNQISRPRLPLHQPRRHNSQQLRRPRLLPPRRHGNLQPPRRSLDTGRTHWNLSLRHNRQRQHRHPHQRPPMDTRQTRPGLEV